MQLIVDTKDTPEHLRLAASFILHLAGDLADEPTAEAPPPPPAPSNVTQLFPTPPAPSDGSSATTAATAGQIPPPPPPPAPNAAVAATAVSASEVPPYTFPTSGATDSTASTATAAAAPPAAATQTTSTTSPFSGQVDSAGLPWDVRIHQKKGGVKKDGTWKLLKGIDMNVVSAVVAELTKGKLPSSVTAPPAPPAQTDAFPAAVGAVPPPPVSSTVPLPPAGTGSNTVPVPPPPATPSVPEQLSDSAAPVPVPPAPAVGSIPATGFRELIKKISAATTAGKVDASKIQSIVQARGCPSLQQLRDMPLIIPEVEADIDALLLG
jgi:hypothetical protein